MKKVNIIYYDNGAGTTKDAIIIDKCLNSKFDISHVPIGTRQPDADINIFVQNIDCNNECYLSPSVTNILIPNLEWMDRYCISLLPKLDYVFAKTAESFACLSKLHSSVIYTGFTSIDRHISSIIKDKGFFHHAGKSIQKNTEAVIEVFSKTDIPITVVDATNRFKDKVTSNITYIGEYVQEEYLNELYNRHQYHICCSINEGWGHYFYESLSCNSTVITVDASPLNELITNNECYLLNCNPVDVCIGPYSEKNNDFPLRLPNYVDKKELSDLISSSFKKKRGRNRYLDIDTNFSKRFINIMELI